MSYFCADLHLHSHYSDGSDPPRLLMEKAKKAGLHALSITDHDTIDAYPEAIEEGIQAGIEVIPGIEISTTFQGHTLHILGYAFSPTDPEIRQLCADQKACREKRNQQLLERLASLLGHSFTELLQQIGRPLHAIGRLHVAHELCALGVSRSPQEAFQIYLGEGKRAYVGGWSLPTEEAIAILHRAQALAILAHPHLLKESVPLSPLLSLPFDGIEGYYGHFSGRKNRRWVQYGVKKKWLVTGGSDYHGHYKPYLEIGSSWVGYPLFSLLKSRYLQNLIKFPSLRSPFL